MHTDSNHGLCEDTLFVIVIYNSVVTQSAAFQTLYASGTSHNSKDIFIYDNSEQSQIIISIDERIHYHHDPQNPGVSGAYNKAFEKARELNKKWLLLADQDMQFPEGALNAYIQSNKHYPDARVLVPQVMANNKFISPFRLIGGKGIRIGPRQPGIHFFRPLCVINSGILIETSLFEDAGGYDELFPMDFSDVIFIERLSAVTKQFVLVGTTCIHSLSSEEDQNRTTNVVFNRFSNFCKAAKIFKKTSNKPVILSLLLLPRSIKLTLMKKDIKFLFLALRTWITSG